MSARWWSLILWLPLSSAWCEALNAAEGDSVDEPWNAVSSLAFCAFVAFGIWKCPAAASSYRTVLHFMLLTGAGSALHHALWTKAWTHAFDVVPMNAFAALSLGYTVETLAMLAPRPSPITRLLSGSAGPTLCCVMLVAYSAGDGIWRQVFLACIIGHVAIQALSLLFSTLGAWPWVKRLQHKLAMCLLLLILGATCWTKDDWGIRERVDGTRYCTISLHAVYHVVAAWAIFLVLTLSLHMRMPSSRVVEVVRAAPTLLYFVEIQDSGGDIPL